MAIRYQVLGDLVVVDHEGAGHHVTGRPGQILAMLLAAHPDSVTAGRLIEEVWGDRPPKDPEATLHNAVSRLRALVSSDLATTPSGYVLVTEDLDSAGYEEAVSKARSSGAVADYRAAEHLWTGSPYRGFEDLPSVQIEVERLTQLERRARFERLEAMTAAGEASLAGTELAGIVDSDLFDEEALGLYMRALYLSGKKPAALQAFQRYERRLADETGLEPSAAIRELEIAILVDQLEVPAAESRPVTGFELAISYLELGNGHRIAIGTAGSGPPLMVHPGWMSKLDMVASGFDMRSPMWAAMSKTHRLTLFDRAGTGLSRPGPGGVTFEESVSELEEVLETAMDAPVPVWAASGAGPIAIKAAVNRPDLISHLILYGTYASGPTTFPANVAESMVALVKASWGMGSDVLAYLLFPSGSSEIVAEWARAQRHMTEPETAAMLLRQLYDADVTEHLPRLETPAIVIHYRDDKAIPIWGGEQLARGIPGARYVPLEGRSHYPLPGEEDKVVGLIDDFIAATSS
ncbi:MAG TPA: alpha/beta fold hydrolase [Acidimicrobiia bacterium]|nr:alpha/beta fold hydrolase [Acidimicrobiia bacterium]